MTYGIEPDKMNLLRAKVCSTFRCERRQAVCQLKLSLFCSAVLMICATHRYYASYLDRLRNSSEQYAG